MRFSPKEVKDELWFVDAPASLYVDINDMRRREHVDFDQKNSPIQI